MTRILIIDDQDILTQGLSVLLSSQPDIDVLATGKNGQEALELCRKHLPDVVLMDIKMPLLNGVQATRLIKRDYPSVQVLILTTFDDDEYIFEALKYGAAGYLLKDAPPEEIAAAIRTVAAGGAPMQPGVAAKVLQRFSTLEQGGGQAGTPEGRSPLLEQLTERELEITRLVGEGLNNGEIAGRLFISEGTVKNHMTRILDKLALRDRTQLAIFAVKHELTK